MTTRKQSKRRSVTNHPMDRSTDFSDARFTIRTVIVLVLFTSSLVGSQYYFAAGLDSKITALGSRMDAKDTIDARDAVAAGKEADAERKITEQWRLNIEKKIDQVERDYKLGDYDLKALITKQR